MAKLPATFEVSITSLSPSGEGKGDFNTRKISVWGAFPGDVVRVRPVRVSKHDAKAVIATIIKPCEARRTAFDAHWISCGPWQVISEDAQAVYKKEMVRKEFSAAKMSLPEDFELVTSDAKTHYRNKMEFSFVDTPEGISIGLHDRGRHWYTHPHESCALAHEKINELGNSVARELRRHGVRAADCKSLIVRYSYFEDKCVAALFAVRKDFPRIAIDDATCKSFGVFYSDPTSPVSKTTEILQQDGELSLVEQVGGARLKYFYENFFQVNPPAFEKVIAYMKAQMEPNYKVGVDLYCGVGTIGLALAGHFCELRSVEFDARAAETVRENAAANGIKNVSVWGGEAEKQPLSEILNGADMIMLDPPRAGMHPKVIKALLASNVPNIWYVSCNHKSQARDMMALGAQYKIKRARLFDFYPQTPHVESVLLLEKK